ncbi:MAG TPA: sigma 54-interacting transcriptional regulator [Longimicrobium sp.]|nr:sigma 54-interacting transcriptional regulator [Longimicrobium sp.]
MTQRDPLAPVSPLSGHEEAENHESLALLDPEARAFARLASASADPVLLYGETGAGKTCLARLVHRLGRAASAPFVDVNCASLPESLFEREMFGHVRGAFTDARESRPGLVEAADGGTLFLDEIGELPATAQPKLLQVLEEGMVRRLGAVRAQRARFRLIAATNRDVGAMLRAGAFREDLYYRCAVLEYRVRPLRERRRELPALIGWFLARNAPPGAAPAEVAPAAMALLCAYPWPGNLRELDNCVRRVIAFAAGGPVEPRHLPERVRAPSAAPLPAERAARGGRAYVAPGDPDQEARMIRDALSAEGGNRTRAAQRLGMSRATLWIKLQRHASRLDAAD